jgi:stage II sporulation protein D
LTLSLAALGVAGAASAGLLDGLADSPVATTTTAPAVTTALVSPMTGDSTAPVTLVISGHGWGHGVGMAQWGTLGYAQHGWDSAKILAHYYPGTTLERRANPTVRVLLLDGVAGAKLGSEARWSVTDAKGAKAKLDAGELDVETPLKVGGKKLEPPFTFSPGKEPLTVAGKPYRGRVAVLATGGKLEVVNELKLEQYIKGVVGLEMPDRWPAAALEVQAVAARTYAVARMGAVGADRKSATYDVYSDTRSQVYGGIEAESPSVSAAVDVTARRVLLYRGKVITAYYSSSSGGRTVSAAEAFGTPIPYLVSVDDPYDTVSPNHDWGPVVYDARKVAKALKVKGSLLDLRAADGPSGHVATVTAAGEGGEVTATGTDIRTMLGLRSTFFSLGWLSLDAPSAEAGYDVLTELTGIARDAGPVVLEAKQVDGSWKTVAPVKPDRNGRFKVSIRPDVSTDYRLAAGDVHAGLVSLTVATVVDASLKAGAVSGMVKPALPGAKVQLQRQRAGAWATVATAAPDTGGSFALKAPLPAGSYRVRWAPGGGFVPGVSQLLAVP